MGREMTIVLGTTIATLAILLAVYLLFFAQPAPAATNALPSKSCEPGRISVAIIPETPAVVEPVCVTAEPSIVPEPGAPLVPEANTDWKMCEVEILTPATQQHVDTQEDHIEHLKTLTNTHNLRVVLSGGIIQVESDDENACDTSDAVGASNIVKAKICPSAFEKIKQAGITNAVLGHLKGMDLKKLDLEGCRMYNEQIATIAGFSLASLNIICTNLTVGCFKKMEGSEIAKTLVQLNAGSNQLSLDDMLVLTRFEKLTRINAAHCWIPWEAVRDILNSDLALRLKTLHVENNFDDRDKKAMTKLHEEKGLTLDLRV